MELHGKLSEVLTEHFAGDRDYSVRIAIDELADRIYIFGLQL